MSMSREKNLDKRLALNTKRLTVVPRKPNTIELDPSDLMNKAVTEIDAQLSVIYGYIAMALAMRQHKAAMENVETPPPAPPRVATPNPDSRAPDCSGTVTIRDPRRNPNALPANPPKKVIWVAGSAVNNAREIIDRCPFGIALTVFREEFEKLHVECDAHSYAKALQRLKSTKHVIIYKKRLFTYNRLKQFLEDLKARLVEDIPEEQPVVTGKWSTAVFEFIRSHKGAFVDYGDIVGHVTRQPGFENASNASSQVAVALKNLQYRHGSIEKIKERGKSQYRLKTEDQKDKPPGDEATSADQAIAERCQ